MMWFVLHCVNWRSVYDARAHCRCIFVDAKSATDEQVVCGEHAMLSAYHVHGRKYLVLGCATHKVHRAVLEYDGKESKPFPWAKALGFFLSEHLDHLLKQQAVNQVYKSKSHCVSTSTFLIWILCTCV